MLYRKIASLIEAHLQSDSNKILLIDGARQVGKTYIVRYVGQKLFENYIEINLVEDALGAGLFANVRTVEDFYLQVSMLAGDRMKEKENTLIFLDEIQAYPHLLTMLKFLAQDGRFTYIASGSLLGVTLAQTPSIPMGSIRKVQMFPLDFEEFLYANGLNEFAITAMRRRFEALEALDEATHNKVMDLFRKGKLRVFVSTDVAARGIDVDDVDIVFNCDIPDENQDYVHRIGRTGRAKRQGVAVSFVADFPSKIRIDDIAKNTRNEILPVKFDENGSLTMA